MWLKKSIFYDNHFWSKHFQSTNYFSFFRCKKVDFTKCQTLTERSCGNTAQASSTAQLQLQRVSCYKCSVGVELNKTVHSWVGIKLQPSDQHQADSNIIPTSLQ